MKNTIALLLSLRARDIPPIHVTLSSSPLSSEEGVDGRSRRKPRRRRRGMSKSEARRNPGRARNHRIKSKTLCIISVEAFCEDVTARNIFFCPEEWPCRGL